MKKDIKESILVLLALLIAILFLSPLWNSPKEIDEKINKYFEKGTPENRGATESLIIGK